MLFHYKISKGIEIPLELLKRLTQSGIDFVRVNGTDLTDEFVEKLRGLPEITSKLIVTDHADRANRIKAWGVFMSHPEVDIQSLKQSYPNLKIGALAHTIADCKNLELADVDFIEMGLPKDARYASSPIGMELFKELIPREEEYGWMILSINTPIFVSGLKSFSQLEQLYATADIAGIIIDDLFEPAEKRNTVISKLVDSFNTST